MDDRKFNSYERTLELSRIYQNRLEINRLMYSQEDTITKILREPLIVTENIILHGISL